MTHAMIQTTPPAIEVRNLHKHYGSRPAVHNVSFSVAPGEIFGLLGHNGAGKTTTLECILGTRHADSGFVRLLGKNPRTERKNLFQDVGVQFQSAGYQDKLKVSEACETAACLYPGKPDWKELLKSFNLESKENQFISTLSGGEKQKLAVLLACINKPQVLFLDELTTGLDPAARRTLWEYLKNLKSQGVAILLTSHYMDEVEYLCDRIIILKKGEIVANGTPGEIIAQHGGKNLEDAFLAITPPETMTEKEMAV